MAVMTLDRLGIAPGERGVIIHADDLGMCHAANTAFAGILRAGTVTCGSIMVPCAWYLEMVALAHAHPEADLGVHLTLTSEWQEYRWRPLSTADPQSGLMDEEGYLWRDVASLHAHMDPDAAVAEMRAQVERALASGVDVTHVDTHMGSVLHPVLAAAYIQLGLEYGLPVMMPRLNLDVMLAQGVPRRMADEIVHATDLAERTGRLFLLDGFTGLDDAAATRDGLGGYRDLLAGLPPGLTHLIYHASDDTDEARAAMGQPIAERRAVDAHVFSSEGFPGVLAASGVHSLGYRALREAMRA